MRILHVVHQYPPDHVAGTELYTRWLAQNQAEAGHWVGVFTPLNRAMPDQPGPAPVSGVRIFGMPVGPRSATAVFLSTFHQSQLANDFAAVLAAEKPDIIHIQHLMGLPVAVVAAIRRSGVPYVVFLHDYWYGCANGQLLTNDTQQVCAGPDSRLHNCGRCAVARAGLNSFARQIGPLIAALMRRRNELLAAVLNGAARIIAPNEFVGSIYRQMGLPLERMVVVPMGVESPPADLLLRSTRPQASSLQLGYIGSISPQKGVHVLIEAVNGLPDDRVSLNIFGDMTVFPDYAAELQRQATHPGIRFGGRLDRAGVWAALAKLDALIFPTLWYEASPFIVREAFAAQVPVIASNIGAPAMMIRDGIDGLLFPAGDPARLRSILESLSHNPAGLAELRRAINPPPTNAEHAAAIDALYREVLSDSPPPSHD